jgi:predicted ester cyclase
MRIQANKQHVWDYWRGMHGPSAQEHMTQHVHADVVWHGFEPFRHITGTGELWEQVWRPLLTAFPDLTRRPYHFIGGHYEGGNWTAGTGDLVGTFVNDWLGVPASGQSVHFRFGEFCKVQDGKIVEIRMIVDLPDLMRQAGFNIMLPSFGRDIWIPGPLAGDGFFSDEQDTAESEKSLRLVEDMIFGGLNSYDGESQESQGLERYWHHDMVWHGPVGIGSVYGMDEFKRNAQGPIVGAFPDRRGPGHQARIAEGLFAASTGWPSLVGTHVNRYMDWEPTGERIGWNIMDFWRRDGDKLRENWVMIDLIGAAKASNVDLWARLHEAVEHR